MLSLNKIFLVVLKSCKSQTLICKSSYVLFLFQLNFRVCHYTPFVINKPGSAAAPQTCISLKFTHRDNVTQKNLEKMFCLFRIQLNFLVINCRFC